MKEINLHTQKLPGETMRIHNQIRTNTTLREREVFLLHYCPTYTFLSMSAAKFISNLEIEHNFPLIEKLLVWFNFRADTNFSR